MNLTKQWLSVRLWIKILKKILLLIFWNTAQAPQCPCTATRATKEKDSQYSSYGLWEENKGLIDSVTFQPSLRRRHRPQSTLWHPWCRMVASTQTLSQWALSFKSKRHCHPLRTGTVDSKHRPKVETWSFPKLIISFPKLPSSHKSLSHSILTKLRTIPKSSVICCHNKLRSPVEPWFLDLQLMILKFFTAWIQPTLSQLTNIPCSIYETYDYPFNLSLFLTLAS